MWSGDGRLDGSAAQLRFYLTTLKRAWLWLGAWCVVCVAVALGYALGVPAQFVSRVDIELTPWAIANDGPENLRHFHQIDLDNQLAATELEIMTSERLLRPVFDQLELDRSPELLQGADGFWQSAARLARKATSGPIYDERQRAYFAFASRVRCLRLGLSYVFEISYRSHDPALAARVANALAAQYLSDRVGREKTRRQRIGGTYAAARWEALTRQWETSRAAAAEGVAPAEDLPAAAARVLGPATPALRKSYPKPAPTMALGLVFGLVSGVLAALVLASARGRATAQEWARAAEVSTSSG
jgi:uncharacterized protein involved in exopolysaccharide biosynthesis